MSTAEEIRGILGENGIVGQQRQVKALRYAVGMLNEIYLLSNGLPEPTDEAEIAIIALEGIKKRLTGEEK
jgi:hypothetical protein